MYSSHFSLPCRLSRSSNVDAKQVAENLVSQAKISVSPLLSGKVTRTLMSDEKCPTGESLRNNSLHVSTAPDLAQARISSADLVLLHQNDHIRVEGMKGSPVAMIEHSGNPIFASPSPGGTRGLPPPYDSIMSTPRGKAQAAELIPHAFAFEEPDPTPRIHPLFAYPQSQSPPGSCNTQGESTLLTMSLGDHKAQAQIQNQWNSATNIPPRPKTPPIPP